MRILILILQYPPDVNSTGLLMEQLVDGLVARGHRVSVITSFPHYEKFRVWEQYRGKLAERSGTILRLWVRATGKKSMLNRLLSYLSFNALATLFGCLSREQYDVIFCTNGGFFSGITAAIIGRRKRAPLIYNVQDLYPETFVQAGQLRNPLAIAGLQKLESLMYRSATHVSVITPSFRSNILKKGVDEYKVSVIPNFVDCEFIRPLPRDNEFSRRHGLQGKFVISHAGNVGFVYDLDTLLDAAALLKSEDGIVFLVVGDGVVRERLRAKAQALGLDNVRFLPFQPRDALPELRAASDVQVALYRPGQSKYSMPSKVYEIMASGRPVLASGDRGSDLWNLIEETNCGLVVESARADRLADAIHLLYQDPLLRAEMGRRGRAYAETRYSLDAVVDKYERLLRVTASTPERRGEAPVPDRAEEAVPAGSVREGR